VPPPPRILTSYFSQPVRAKGADYAAAGRVRGIRLSTETIDATVEGDALYVVRVECLIEHSAAVVSLGCSCPFFDQELKPCKHLWAALVAACDQGWTGSAVIDAIKPSALDVIPIPVSELLALGHQGPVPGRAGAPSPGDLFVKGLDAQITTRDAARPPFRYAPDELIYVIDIAATERSGAATLELAVRKRKRDGSWSRPQPARIYPVEVASAPPADAEVLATIFGAAQSHAPWQGVFSLNDALGRVVIPAAAATGRLYLRERASAEPFGPIAWDAGPPWRFRLVAERTGDAFRIDGRFEREAFERESLERESFERETETIALDQKALALASGFLFTRRMVARVDWRGGFGVFTSLAKSGAVDVADNHAPRLGSLLARANVPAADLPEELRVEAVSVAPRPRLHLRTLQSWRANEWMHAEVIFDYDGTPLEPGGAAVEWDAVRGRLVRRDEPAEAAAMERLASLGVSVRPDAYTRDQVRTVSVSAMPAVVRALVRDGWLIDADGKTFQPAGAVRLSVQASTDIDWFDLKGTVDFGGAVMPLPEILAALARGDSTIRLGDASVGLLPEEWLRRYGPIAAWGAVEGDRVRFRRSQTALLDALLLAQEEATSVTVDERFASARRELQRFERIAPADPPSSFQGVLRGYQRDGIGWMRFLRQFGFGGCLADDMGLGKTVMVLAQLEWWRIERNQPGREPAGPRASLVVVPRSLVQNWILEARRFTPELRVLDYSHVKRAGAEETFADHDVVLITYGTLRRDVTHLSGHEFEYVILDEAQSIKNAATASAKAARLLNGRHRLALSGTPIENHLGELWSLFEFLNPGMLGAMRVFQHTSGPSRTIEPETAAVLSRALRPFILRRTKEQVAPELPERTEQTISCELDVKQRAYYDGLRAHYRQSLLGHVDKVGLGKSRIQILEALLRLRQAACHPGLIDAAHHSAGSAKLDVLIPQLTEVMAEGHKALVFSQFTSFLALLRARLDDERVTYEYLDGDTRDRQSHVDRFQTDPDCRLFLISLKAGGLGLNLTAADYVFLLDPWWNPAVEAQAIDRTHRIGQTRHVFAYRLIAGDTVEEKVLELQKSKRDLADAILRADSGLVGQLGREDLELLLS
jgi:superfamily II DNA or RNA helicase